VQSMEVMSRHLQHAYEVGGRELRRNHTYQIPQ
jgi:hypothetical protein